MTIAYWCVFIVIVLPYIWVLAARLPGFSLERNLRPRVVSDSFSGLQQRFYWAHLNALEAVAPFAAVVIIAHNLQLEQVLLDTLAMSFVGFRLAHAVAYAANQGMLRTAMFAGAMISMVAIFIQST